HLGLPVVVKPHQGGSGLGVSYASTANELRSAMVAILIPVLWLMPQPDKNPYRPQVNLSQVAAESTQQAGFPVAVPQLESWHYNYARWTGNTPDNIAPMIDDFGVEADDLHQVGHDDLHDGGDTIGV
ncbi:MAG: DUF4245 family protein, partial [Corynebacterium matruchotii]